MRGNVAFYIHAFGFPVFFGKGKYFVQRLIIEVILELIRKVSVLWRFVLWTPIKTIIFLPFPFKRLTVSCSSPEFRFFHKYSVDSRIDDRLHMLFLQIRQEVIRRYNIRNHMAMPYGILLPGNLPFIEMPLAIPLPCEIILIFTPGNPGHEMDGISSIFPGFHPLRERHPLVFIRWIPTYTVDHDRICPIVDCGAPFSRSLKGRFDLFCCIVGNDWRAECKQTTRAYAYFPICHL